MCWIISKNFTELNKKAAPPFRAGAALRHLLFFLTREKISGSYLSAHTKQNLSIHSISENGRKPVKKISASATVLLTLKVEVQSPYNRITISYNRKGHRAFAVFLLSIFVGKCRRAVSDMRCRSPPLHLDFLHFKNSDGRYLW